LNDFLNSFRFFSGGTRSEALAKEVTMLEQRHFFIPVSNCDMHPEEGNLYKWVGSMHGPDGSPDETVFHIAIVQRRSTSTPQFTT
jgi:hypothetical protein